MAVEDVVFVTLGLFAFAVVLVGAMYMFGQFFDKMQEHEQFSESMEAVTVMEDARGKFKFFDMSALILYIGINLVMIISLYLLNTHPAFVGVYWLFLLCFLVMTPFITDMWESFIQTSPMNTVLTGIPIINHLLGNLTFYTMVTGILSLVFTFAKPGGARGVGA